MRMSVKARYGLSAMICLAGNYDSGEVTTIISLADKLKISKIYLEQVFSLLKHACLVTSVKGAQGGYQLAKAPNDITVFALLSAIETALFEKTETTVSDSEKAIEDVIQATVFNALDDCVKETLAAISLKDLADEVAEKKSEGGHMYYL